MLCIVCAASTSHICAASALVCPLLTRRMIDSLIYVLFSYGSAQSEYRSALQVLHKVCELSRRYNYFPGGMALTWMGYYESCIASDQSCINEWNAMKDLETTRPDSPSMFVDKSVNMS